MLLRRAAAKDHRDLVLRSVGQLTFLGNDHMAIGHHQHRVAGCLDNKTRAASLADLRDLELDEDRRVLDLIQNLPVDRLPPAPRRESQNRANPDDRSTHVRAPVVSEVTS